MNKTSFGRLAKIAIVTTMLACAALTAGAIGTAVAADLSPSVYHASGYVGGDNRVWGWDSRGWGWDSGPYAGYVGTDWGCRDAHASIDVRPGYQVRHVVVPGYPHYVPLADTVYYGGPWCGF
jgi:opacity protein-like surface antigen